MTTETTETDDDFDLGLADYEAPRGATRWHVFEDLPGKPAFLTRAIGRRLNPELASELQRSPRQTRDKSHKPEDIARADADDRRENRALAAKHLVVGWRGFTAGGKPVTFAASRVKRMVDQIPAGLFDRYFAACLDESAYTPAMTAAAVEDLSGK